MTAAPARSLLYVPADRPDRFGSAFGSGADAVIIDLEDAVPPAARAAAAADLADRLAGAATAGVRVVVRVATGAAGRELLHAVLRAHVDEVLLAKAETADDVRATAALLDRHGAEARIVPLLESPGALADAAKLMHERVARLQLGEADLRAALGLPSGSDAGLAYAREMLVFTSARLGLEPPTGSTAVDFRDLDALAASTRTLRDLGFFGRTCIHPAQVSVVNKVFTPTVEEASRAARIAAAPAGASAADGALVDPAVQRSAERTLRLAQALGIPTE
jgi:citrate lyase subunit beta/citryl-CoA lyase